MSREVIVKFAPIASTERLGNPIWERAGRTLFWPGALKFLPTQSEIPLVVDHSMERQVGVVTHLFQLDWTDGGPWICARAQVDNPPGWLKPHETKASFGRWDIHSTPVGESHRVHSAWIREVSLLVATEPAEPLACVLSVRPTKERIVRASRPAPTPVGEVIHTPHDAVIRRPSGQVLGVR